MMQLISRAGVQTHSWYTPCTDRLIHFGTWPWDMLTPGDMMCWQLQRAAAQHSMKFSVYVLEYAGVHTRIQWVGL
jgi:hypothetical protein